MSAPTMKAQAHTPGPWVLDDPKHAHVINNGDNYHSIDAGVGFYEAEGRYANKGFGLAAFMCSADARLIAAAPEMLAALRQAVVLLAGACVHSPELEPHETYEAVSAAIAKATGAQA